MVGQATTGICSALRTYFRFPSFCSCVDAKFGGDLTCSVGLDTFINIGARAWVLPCGSPASVGVKAWAAAMGATKVKRTSLLPPSERCVLAFITDSDANRALKNPLQLLAKST